LLRSALVFNAAERACYLPTPFEGIQNAKNFREQARSYRGGNSGRLLTPERILLASAIVRGNSLSK